MDSPHPHVLLISADTTCTDDLAEELGDLGLTVVTAFSTSEAMDIAARAPPDVALVDSDMEGGEELRAWIQHRFRTTICYVAELGPPGGEPLWETDEGQEAVPPRDHDDLSELVSMLLSALANVRAARIRAGLV